MPKPAIEEEHYVKIGANPEHFLEAGAVRILRGDFAGQNAIRLESKRHPRPESCGVTVVVRGFVLNLPSDCVIDDRTERNFT